MNRPERYKLFSYTLFGLALVILLAGLIPAMFSADLAMAVISAVLITLCLIAAMFTGKIGFAGQAGVEENVVGKRQGEAGKGGGKVSYEPENMPMDDENWRRVHGSPPPEPPHRTDEPPPPPKA